MFNHKHYVAVLRWRKGELAALQKLYDRDRKIITALAVGANDTRARPDTAH